MKYLVTICKAQKKGYVDESELRAVMEFLKEKKVYVIDYSFEVHGMYRQLHVHLVVKYYGRWKDLLNFQGFRIYWSQVYDIVNALNYLNKLAYCRLKQEEILTENKYQVYRFLKE